MRKYPNDYTQMPNRDLRISQDAKAAYQMEERLNVETLGCYPDLLTVQHLQELTGLSAQTIRAEINRGNLPGCRIGRRLYVPKQQFIQYAMEGGGLSARSRI